MPKSSVFLIPLCALHDSNKTKPVKKQKFVKNEYYKTEYFKNEHNIDMKHVSEYIFNLVFSHQHFLKFCVLENNFFDCFWHTLKNFPKITWTFTAASMRKHTLTFKGRICVAPSFRSTCLGYFNFTNICKQNSWLIIWPK